MGWCCRWATLFRMLGDKIQPVSGDAKMDVYVNHRRDLLVVKKGALIPAAAPPGSWRKSNKRVVKVSAEIESAIETRGYYMRKLTQRLKRHAGF